MKLFPKFLRVVLQNSFKLSPDSSGLFPQIPRDSHEISRGCSTNFLRFTPKFLGIFPKFLWVVPPNSFKFSPDASGLLSQIPRDTPEIPRGCSTLFLGFTPKFLSIFPTFLRNSPHIPSPLSRSPPPSLPDNSPPEPLPVFPPHPRRRAASTARRGHSVPFLRFPGARHRHRAWPPPPTGTGTSALRSRPPPPPPTLGASSSPRRPSRSPTYRGRRARPARGRSGRSGAAAASSGHPRPAPPHRKCRTGSAALAARAGTRW